MSVNQALGSQKHTESHLQTDAPSGCPGGSSAHTKKTAHQPAASTGCTRKNENLVKMKSVKSGLKEVIFKK